MKRSVITTISICLLLAACTTTGNKPPANQAAPKQNQNAPKTQRVQQTNPGPAKNQSAQATADRLVELAKRVPKVNGATAVVVGKYAVVGIDVNAHLDRPQVGVIKYSVAEALKEDPQGATALVTADPDIVQRLREMGADIRNGRPVSGFAEEMADIVGRIIPQTPARVQKREQKPSRENEQRINNNGRSKPQGNDKINVNRKTSP